MSPDVEVILEKRNHKLVFLDKITQRINGDICRNLKLYGYFF